MLNSFGSISCEFIVQRIEAVDLLSQKDVSFGAGRLFSVTLNDIYDEKLSKLRKSVQCCLKCSCIVGSCLCTPLNRMKNQ